MQPTNTNFYPPKKWRNDNDDKSNIILVDASIVILVDAILAFYISFFFFQGLFDTYCQVLLLFSHWSYPVPTTTMVRFEQPRAFTEEEKRLPLPVLNRARNKTSQWKRAFLGLVVVLFLFLVSQRYLPIPFFHRYHQSLYRHSKRTNIILMISDGYGPASETFGRSFHQAVTKNTSPTAHYKTPLDKIMVGSHRSRSSNSLITDSAAGATAFACGLKSYNGAIGVDAKGQLCATVFEGAKEKGLLTGVVVTTRLTDAVSMIKSRLRRKKSCCR